ncbi:histidine phosphatase family protein [Pseudoalteromonas sp. NEC-BIFX-2020_002]|uniref:histidine phosphatase family protein n=1 Tax=Pseudoalteromonas sp. NEC-BIFX-2020_002 TaxID=2732353 RepID=UPI0014778873|nr:histidine phosphatase family protein [Pseudoalteromonas sp. NEC-BIFX-2020_002]NNG42310.1 histidine phosphatase family protein [Pseudoalteromonas sp. NEC-BIFX-2020_002]
MKILLSVLIVFFSAYINAQPEQIYLFRHSEKLTDKDPHLSARGEIRAQQLHSLINTPKTVTLYSTHYNRTLETAAPLADHFKVRIATYDPSKLVALQQDILTKSGTVIIIGHSNTTVELAQLFNSVELEKMPESEFDRYFLLNKESQGYTLNDLKMGF